MTVTKRVDGGHRPEEPGREAADALRQAKDPEKPGEKPRAPAGRPTITDVARAAGVSTSTVSAVLNGRPGRIPAETRARVLQAAEALKYRPNSLARGLKTKRSYTIALVATDLSNPFYPGLARGIEQAALSQGYHLIICTTFGSLERERQHLVRLLDWQVDGVLLSSSITRHDTDYPVELLRDVRVVLLNRTIAGLKAPTVLMDNAGAGYLVGKHLLSLGYSTIAYIGGPKGRWASEDRLRGLRRALSEAGLPLPEAWVRHGDWEREEEGYRLALSLFSMPGPRPRAVFAGNDIFAVGVIRAVRELGWSVPEDVAVVGFDDRDIATVSDPQLTTVHYPAREIGYHGARILLDAIEKPDAALPDLITLPCQLVIRGSCGGRPEASSAPTRIP